MSESWWSFRCVGVPRAVLDAEIARMAACLPPSAVVDVEYGAESDLTAEVSIHEDTCGRAEVATGLGGLVWFTRWNTREELDLRALYFEGALVFEVTCCGLLECDELEIGPGALALSSASLEEILEPRDWIMRLAGARFGLDFERVAGGGRFEGSERREVAGTGAAVDQVREGAAGAAADASADDDIPF